MMANADINGDGITEVFQNSEKEQLIAFKSFLYDDLCEYKAEADDLSKYDDFHTIDWSRDRMRDRMRLRKVSKLKNEGNTLNKVKGFYDALSGWLIVFIVGVTTGLFGSIIVITSEWVTDLKEGVCKSQILFNKQTCCWNAEVGKLSIDGCKEWLPWSDIFKLNTFSQRESYIFNFFCYVFSALLFSGISVSLVRFFAPYASGSGIAEVKTILGGFVIKGFLGWWTLLIKSVALIFSVSTGLKLGMEGPMVHIGACVGNVIVRLFPKYHGNEAKRREVLSAAAASGVSVAFGAPIGGVLFSLEEISYYFSMKILWRTFLCSMMAALTIWYLNPYGNGHLVIYSIDYNIPWNLFEIIPFILLGIYGGCFGAFFIKCNIFWCRMRKTKKFGNYPMTEVFVLTIFTALISYPNEFTRMSMSQLIYMLFQNCSPDDTSILCDYSYVLNRNQTINNGFYPHRTLGPGVYESIWKLVVATLVISIMTVLTFGVKLPAGLFVPSLAAGACAGRVLGIGIEALVESYPTFFLWSSACSKSKTHCILPGLYAMAGAAAALGGVTRMTVTLVVIMFEVTGGLTYVAPIMIVVITCKWVGEALAADSVYIEHIRLKGFPYLNTKEEYDEAFLASDIMQPSRYGEPMKCILKNGSTVKDIETLLVETKFNGFPVIVDNESYRLSGFVTRRDLKVALHYGKLRNKNCDSSSVIYFSKRFPSNEISQDVSTLSFRHILDLSPFTVTDSTPVVIVIDMFQKLGLRQVLVTHGGKLLGIITKKDVLRHIAQVKHFDPGHILYD
ncbi:H(+)/Cl(-) exchange transporter 5 isoform X1 [Hydra vulgaris]|uniref:H(+)/Cl(-) exchange transporter 5 isoform X1 n=1 Tax=Hydra vulgaris TaxID=6087 RepID=UPI0006413269|nr:H(+)/Cl(-) exchange transporter 5 [Hydra vulgaris]